MLTEHNTEHTLKDLIVWREEEIIGTEMLCKGIDDKIPFFCLARGSDEETVVGFYELVFERKHKKAYLSFPMTAVSDIPQVQQAIGKFRRTMKSLFTCFDPGDLEESCLPLKAQRARANGHKYVEVTAMGENVQVALADVEQIERDISSQTYARDFMLIDQSDIVIGFIPTLPDGRAAISSGVERELQHAHEAAKETYVIWTGKQTPSVFVTQTATAVFTGVGEAMDFFAKKGYIVSK